MTNEIVDHGQLCGCGCGQRTNTLSSYIGDLPIRLMPPEISEGVCVWRTDCASRMAYYGLDHKPFDGKPIDDAASLVGETWKAMTEMERAEDDLIEHDTDLKAGWVPPPAPKIKVMRCDFCLSNEESVGGLYKNGNGRICLACANAAQNILTRTRRQSAVKMVIEEAGGTLRLE